MVHSDLGDLLINITSIIVDVVIVSRRVQRFEPVVTVEGVRRYLMLVAMPHSRLRRGVHHRIIVVNSLAIAMVILSLIHFHLIY